MKGKGGPLTSTWAVMALLILGTAAFGIAALGAERAMNIASAAALAVVTDGLLQQTPVHALERVEVNMYSDVPSEVALAGTVDQNGVAFQARSIAVVDKEHVSDHMGRSIHIDLEQVGPFGPFREVELCPAGGLSKLEGMLAFWIAGRMGLAVPYVELVEVIWNGRSIGIMELRERVGPDLELNRHLGDHPVSIFTRKPMSGPMDPWRSSQEWEIGKGIAGTTAAGEAHNALLALLQDTLSFPGQGSDSLEKLIDVDAFLSYLAAWTLIHGDPYQAFREPCLVFSDRSERFYPVLWRSTQEVADTTYEDLLVQMLFAVPEWNQAYEAFVQEALRDLHTDGNFQRQLDLLADRLRPAIAADRMRTGPVSDHPGDVMHYSILHWERAVRQLGTTRYNRWRALLNTPGSTAMVPLDNTFSSNTERHGTERTQR